MVADNRGGSPDGTDTVTNVENFQFSDGTVAARSTAIPTVPNKIALENLKQGNPESEWGIDGDGDYTSIQGFATEISSQYRADGRLQDRDQLDQLPDRHLSARLLWRRWRPQGGYD